MLASRLRGKQMGKKIAMLADHAAGPFASGKRPVVPDREDCKSPERIDATTGADMDTGEKQVAV
jgi:hypothetical protein